MLRSHLRDDDVTVAVGEAPALVVERRAGYGEVGHLDETVGRQVEIEGRQVVRLRQRRDDAAGERDERDRRQDLRHRHGDVAAGVEYQLDEHGAHLLKITSDAGHSHETNRVRCTRTVNQSTRQPSLEVASTNIAIFVVDRKITQMLLLIYISKCESFCNICFRSSYAIVGLPGS